jgi:hypothetical protein
MGRLMSQFGCRVVCVCHCYYRQLVFGTRSAESVLALDRSAKVRVWWRLRPL